jgi:DHA1 family multidrug resistance protein-like MFS transporter
MAGAEARVGRLTSLRSSSWVWLLVLFTVAGFVEAAFWSQMVAFTPLFLRELGVTTIAEIESLTGVIAAVSTLIGLPLLPFWGALADRYSRQPVIVRSFVAHALAGAVAMAAGNVWVFVIGRSISSFSLGNSGLMMTTLQERAPARRIGFAFAVMAGASPLGAVLGPLGGGPIVDAWGFRALMGIDVAVMVLVIGAMTFGYVDHFRPQQRAPLLGMAVDGVRIILRSPRLRLLFPALLLLFAGWMLAYTYAPLVIERVYTGPPEQLGTTIGLVFGLSGVATLLLGPVVGAMGDRYGHWRTLFVAAGAAVLIWPLPALATDLLTFTLPWALVNGISSSVFSLSFNVMSSSATDATRGRVMTFAYLPVNVGFALGPTLGAIVARASGLPAIFPLAAVLTLLGIGALAIARRQPLERPVMGRTTSSVQSS